jgi:hypothetical protein
VTAFCRSVPAPERKTEKRQTRQGARNAVARNGLKEEKGERENREEKKNLSFFSSFSVLCSPHSRRPHASIHSALLFFFRSSVRARYRFSPWNWNRDERRRGRLSKARRIGRVFFLDDFIAAATRAEREEKKSTCSSCSCCCSALALLFSTLSFLKNRRRFFENAGAGAHSPFLRDELPAGF